MVQTLNKGTNTMKEYLIANSMAVLTKVNNKVMANFIAPNGVEANKEVKCDNYPEGAATALAYIESYCCGDKICTPKVLAVLGGAK